MSGGLAGRTWVHVIVGAVLMGGWAMLANKMHPASDMIQAGAVQAALSGILTACLKTIADRLRRVVPHWTLAALGALLVSATLLLTTHHLAGTPEILVTVFVPLLVSGTYIFTYCYLGRERADG